jgi:hypothetical protein
MLDAQIFCRSMLKHGLRSGGGGRVTAGSAPWLRGVNREGLLPKRAGTPAVRCLRAGTPALRGTPMPQKSRTRGKDRVRQGVSSFR